MPANQDHAYGDSPVYPHIPAWLGLAYRLASPLHPKLQARVRVAAHWRQFLAHATIARSARLGVNAWCVNRLHDKSRIVIGERTICRGLLSVQPHDSGRIVIAPDVYIGDDTLISSAAGVEIGRYTLIAHQVNIFDNNGHPAAWEDRITDWEAHVRGEGMFRPVASAPVRIDEAGWIGLNSVILKGVSVRDRSIVAAGSAVTRNVPAQTAVAGNPAQVVKVL